MGFIILVIAVAAHRVIKKGVEKGQEKARILIYDGAKRADEIAAINEKEKESNNAEVVRSSAGRATHAATYADDNSIRLNYAITRSRS